ncbi:hypothetical protein Tco_0929773, partial [Tanacetum coccineum]
MVVLRKRVNFGAAVGKHVLLQVAAKSLELLLFIDFLLDLLLTVYACLLGWDGMRILKDVDLVTLSDNRGLLGGELLMWRVVPKQRARARAQAVLKGGDCSRIASCFILSSGLLTSGLNSMQEDIQCASSDTRPPMLDRTDFESWQQCIRLYCLGKDNGENIMKESQLYDEFEHFRQVKGEDIQGYYVRFTKLINDMRNIKMTMYKMQLNLKFVNNMLPEWSRFITEVKLNRDGKVVVQDVRGKIQCAIIRKDHFRETVHGGNGVAGNVGAQNRGGMIIPGQAKTHIREQVTNVDDDVDDLPENDLALNVDHVFEADECDAFDSDVDEGPTSQTMFMANLTSEDPIYDEVKPSYDSNNPFEVQDHDTFVDYMDEYHEVHEMQNDVQHNYVVDSDTDYTNDSNIIPYDQYVEDNEEHVVQCNVQMSILDEMHEQGVLMSILDEMHEQGVQSRLANKPDMVVNDSVTSELARYRELVGEYEKRAKFELTDRERKIDEQIRIIISDRNRKETSLKSELHSVQILLSSTVGHYKSKTEEVTILKKDFKQKEDKILEEFLDIKKLKEKVEDRLYKQDESVQTVHMLCKPKSFYDEKNKIAEITRKRMLVQMQSPLCMENQVRISPPPDYSKENFLATFAPQRNLTPEQIFWSIDDNNRKKAETLAPKPIS